MKIVKTTTVADKVLRALVTLLKKDTAFSKAAEATIVPYVNGREKGWGVEVYDGTRAVPAVTFAENRNSDQIVVYTDNRLYARTVDGATISDYTRERHGISKAGYETAKYYRARDIQGAANAALAGLVKQFWVIQKEEADAKN